MLFASLAGHASFLDCAFSSLRLHFLLLPFITPSDSLPFIIFDAELFIFRLLLQL